MRDSAHLYERSSRDIKDTEIEREETPAIINQTTHEAQCVCIVLSHNWHDRPCNFDFVIIYYTPFLLG